MGDNWCFGAFGSEVVCINTYIPDVFYGIPSTLCLDLSLVAFTFAILSY